MAFSSGVTTGLGDLMTKLGTFLTANGWVQDQVDTGTGKAAFHNSAAVANTSGCWVSFRWQVSPSVSNVSLGVYQALNFDSVGTDPGAHSNDSGNGTVSGTATTIDGARSVTDMGEWSSANYWFFLDATYCHIVLEVSELEYRHFGFGLIDKVGDWSGGEYVYGHNAPVYTPDSSLKSWLLDGANTGSTADKFNATIRVEGMPNQDGSEVWGVVRGSDAAITGTDSDGNDRSIVIGGARGGPTTRIFSWMPASNQTAHVAMTPVQLFYLDIVQIPKELFYLGTMKDVRTLNMKYYQPEEEITIGSDTWVLFPEMKKGAATQAGNLAVAYRKVT